MFITLLPLNYDTNGVIFKIAVHCKQLFPFSALLCFLVSDHMMTLPCSDTEKGKKAFTESS